MKILHVESNNLVAYGIDAVLIGDGYKVERTATGAEGAELASVFQYDVLLCGAELADMNGLQLLKELRKAAVNVPFVVTGNAACEEKPKYLNAGADDYIQAGYKADELIAVLNAVARRSRGFGRPLIRLGELTLDLNGKVVLAGHHRLHLTGKEYQMIELLALRKGCVTKEAIMNQLYGGMDEPAIKIIDVFICKLRRKLTKALGCAHDAYIETIWGRGYALHAPEAVAAE